MHDEVGVITPVMAVKPRMRSKVLRTQSIDAVRTRD
jgi:hypothetical protein